MTISLAIKFAHGGCHGPKDLKGIIDKDAWKEGCVHACVKKKDAEPERVFARIDGRLVVCSSKKDLIKKIKEAVA